MLSEREENWRVSQESARRAFAAAFFLARSASARAFSSRSMRAAWVSVWTSCSRKSEGTVRTDSESTSTRDEVEAVASVTIWGGWGAAAWRM